MPWAVRAAPLEAYGHLPTIEEVSISPDGGKLGAIWTNGDERRVVIRNLADGGTRVLGVGRAKIRSLDWAGPDHLLITASTTATVADVSAPRSEWWLGSDYNYATNKLRPLLNDTRNAMNVIAGPPAVRMIDGKPIIFVEGIQFVSNRGQDALFSIDPETDRSTLVNQGFLRTNDWLVGLDGKPAAESEYDQKTGEWVLKVAHGIGWRTVVSLSAPNERPSMVGLGRDGVSILVAEPQGEATALREVSPLTGNWPEPFRVAPYAPPIHDPATHKLIGFQSLRGDEVVYEFLNPADAAAWAKVQRAYKGMKVSLVSWSDDRNRVVVLADSPTEGPTYALVDFKARRADPIGALYENLQPADIATVKPVRYKAKDGLEITGYLTLPNGRAAKALPLVVLPHGGPAV
ncbi:MAG TPA: S9 family peptidase, partial [Phenylobacterium sp.]|nr:S9 family peptidase [Phenylobacterium sp.]